jgi:16S rRNA (uracil1498-N3)-methyltransferase
MPDFRVFCQPSEAGRSEIVLSGEASRHLLAVNRVRPGDTAIALDAKGLEGIHEIEEPDDWAARSSP